MAVTYATLAECSIREKKNKNGSYANISPETDAQLADCCSDNADIRQERKNMLRLEHVHYKLIRDAKLAIKKGL